MLCKAEVNFLSSYLSDKTSFDLTASLLLYCCNFYFWLHKTYSGKLGEKEILTQTIGELLAEYGGDYERRLFNQLKATWMQFLVQIGALDGTPCGGQRLSIGLRYDFFVDYFVSSSNKERCSFFAAIKFLRRKYEGLHVQITEASEKLLGIKNETSLSMYMLHMSNPSVVLQRDDGLIDAFNMLNSGYDNVRGTRTFVWRELQMEVLSICLNKPRIEVREKLFFQFPSPPVVSEVIGNVDVGKIKAVVAELRKNPLFKRTSALIWLISLPSC